MSAENELNRDWPDEAEKVELEQFARKFEAAKPQLSAQALKNVRARMQRQLAAQVAPAPRRAAWSIGLAAGLMLGTSLYLFFQTSALPALRATKQVAQKPPAPPQPQLPAPKRLVEQFQVEFASPPPAVPQKPLMALDNYRSLYQEL